MIQIKHFLAKRFQKSGRNFTGKITIYHRGGGNKRKYRIIDFKRYLWNVSAIVARIEYDPNRTAYIALIIYNNGIFSYILAPSQIKIGDSIETGTNISFLQPGNCLPLKYIPLGLYIHNIQLYYNKKFQLIRAAGTFAQILRKRLNYVLVRLSSGEQRYVLNECFATIGQVSNIESNLIKLTSAGQNRWKGKRPHVRAASMNPVDHPLGGRTRGGKLPVSPTGKLKGKKTVKKFNKFILKKVEETNDDQIQMKT